MNITSLSTLTSAFNSVKLSNLKIKYQVKKQKAEKQELTAEQRERQSIIDRMQEQAEADRKNAKVASIEAKFKSSGSLSADEIAYLQKERPGYYEELVKQHAEAEGYKKALQSCKTKEDVSSLHMVKLSQFMTEANAITNNPVIPKGKKLELMMKLESRLEGVSKVQTEFTTSEEYARLPSIYDEEEKPVEEEQPVEEEPKTGDTPKTDTGEETDSAAASEDTESAGGGKETKTDRPEASRTDTGEAKQTTEPEKKPRIKTAEHAEKKPAVKKAVKADTHVDEAEVKRFISYEIERHKGFKSKQVDVKI